MNFVNDVSEAALINLISSDVQFWLSSTRIGTDVDTKAVADALTDVAIRSVVTTMIRKYKYGDAIDTVTNMFVLQYEETDWAFITYVFESLQYYALGDSIALPIGSGKELVVVRAVTRMKDGLLLTRYDLQAEQDIRYARYENDQATGIALTGSVWSFTCRRAGSMKPMSWIRDSIVTHKGS
ncbi:hypothetical protein AZ66_30035 [Paenibacillus sp. E194]|nr:hypothetical protein AZ66_30035 [Paenibacillus sp. E194]